ncbi:MAG: CDP-alcohol phosphatidyltransferase family protein, partial [Gaiellaceae bacterium]
SLPSIAELRAVTQPEGLLTRAAGEHWAGRLYMRRLSPHVTRLLLRTSISATAVTWLMIPAGLLAALSLSFPGVLPALGAVALVQLQLLLDCADGEVARWRRKLSAAGVYLDQIAHYSTEAALAAALGIRADGGWNSIGGWTAVGLAVAVLILLLKSETHLVGFALARAGKAAAEESTEAAAEPARRVRLRQGMRLLPFIRPFQAVEATLLALAAAAGDAIAGGLVGSRVLLLVLVAAAVVAVCGHLLAVLASGRLR